MMFGNQPSLGSGEPLNMGLSISLPISSLAGSSILLFAQPFLSASVKGSTAVLIGSEILLFIARHLFQLTSISVLDASNGQTVQMSLTELQGFLRWMSNGLGTMPTINQENNGVNGDILTNQDGQTTGDRSTGFINVTTPEAPLIVSIYFSASYSNEPFTPAASLFIPILTFPGIRGALPMLILGLLATIFVRAVVPPETTGSKPLLESDTSTNAPLTYSPNELLQLLNKFGNKIWN